jgi:FlaA1/EpsC-like NDP-sugar epimerase
MSFTFKNKRIIVTGACGTIGSELIRQLLTNNQYCPGEVIGLDNNENNIFFMDQAYLDFKNSQFFVCDIKNLDELKLKLKGIDIVFHTAALKHVVLSERSPEQAVDTNIIGVQNIIAAANINKVEKVIFTSSDKAVNPTNVMGTSKLMGERLITAANSNKQGKGPIFSSTRFGNVLGSNGSVVPIFHNQIINGGPITLTDKAMTRFIMTIEEAVRLVIDSTVKAQGGEVFITKMDIVRISDLAEAMIELLAPKYHFEINKIKINEIGQKPGEKVYEELMNEEEVRRTVELKNYFSVLPAFRGIYHDIKYNYEDIISPKVKKAYISKDEKALTKQEIKDILIKNNLLGKPDQYIAKRYWPGDKEQST